MKAYRFVIAAALSAHLHAHGQQMSMPPSEMDYPGAHPERAFVAMEPYVLNIMGTLTPSDLGGAPRTHDFSGVAPFVNPQTRASDPWMLQAWDVELTRKARQAARSLDVEYMDITNDGIPGRVTKAGFDGEPATLLRYVAGDGITHEKGRSQLNSWAVPPRTHVRWDLEVAFGQADGKNDWHLTPPASWIDNGKEWVLVPGASPVLFWQLRLLRKSTQPAMAAHVDTDPKDPAKLSIYFTQKSGENTPAEIGRVHGVPRHTRVPISIEAFLDERDGTEGGKGLLHIRVNGQLVVEKAGPTLSPGADEHSWQLDAYLWNEPQPYKYTRSVYLKTAKMVVFPAGQ